MKPFPDSGAPVRAVTFDVGGTLIEPWPSVGQLYADAAARHGCGSIPAGLLQSRFRDAWRTRPRFDHARAGWAALVDEVFRGLTDAPPSATFFPELYGRFAQADSWRVFGDVAPTLDALAAAGVRLGIISNWDERLRPLLRSLDLERRFESIVISCEAGAVKPDGAIFDLAAAAFGLPPASILHVGDSLDHDVRGARAAGFRAVQVRRNPGATAPGDAIRDLSELLTGIVPTKAKTDKSG